MKHILAASVLALAMGLSAPAFAAPSEADCKATFAKIDANNSGWIEGDEAKPYIDALKAAGKMADDANADGKLNADEFMAGCTADHFKDVPAK